MNRVKLLVLLCVVWISGCALSPSTIEDRTPELTYATNSAIAVAVIDSRPDVLSGENTDNYEGVLRAVYGIPQNFVNQRGDADGPLSKRLADIVMRGLYVSGSKIERVELANGTSTTDAVNEMKKSGHSKILIMNVKESHIDAGGARWSYFYTYDVTALDTTSGLVSSKTFKGEAVDFQRDIYHSGSEKGVNYHPPAILDIEYTKRIAEVLNQKDISAVLSGNYQSAGQKNAAATQAPAANIDQATQGRTQRLIALKQLYDDGVITKEDYEKWLVSRICG